MRDVAGRYHRIDQLLKQHFGKITPSLAAEFMGDHIDAVVGRERGAGFTVGGVNTVESVVFAPRKGFFWVASGKEPVCMNEYTGFDFHALFTGSESLVSPAALPGYSWQSTAKKAGLKSYMDAFFSYRENPSDGKTAAGHLEKALRDDPDEPSYVRMYASFLIQEGNYAKAVSLLNKALAMPQANNEMGMAYLLIAQAFDMQGQREAALTMYGKVTDLRTTHGNDHFSGISDALLAKAVQGLRKPLKMKDVEEITAFSMQSGIE
jgi:tetratricopeptide (TPR) repeat protein